MIFLINKLINKKLIDFYPFSVRIRDLDFGATNIRHYSFILFESCFGRSYKFIGGSIFTNHKIFPMYQQVVYPWLNGAKLTELPKI